MMRFQLVSRARREVPHVTIGHEKSNNINLYYEDCGSGRPVVLIHGYPLAGASWERQITALLDAGYRTIAYDRRGFGKSSQPATGYNYDTFAEDLHKLITHLKLRDLTLVGFSIGGGDIVRYLENYGSRRVSRAVFISGVPPYLPKTGDNSEGIVAGLFARIEKGMAGDRGAFLGDFFKDFYNTDLLLDRPVSEHAVRASFAIAAGACVAAGFPCVSAGLEDFREELHRVDVPTLVIWGDADRILPIGASGSRASMLIKGARVRVVEGGPHGIPWTHAEEVNAEMLGFLAARVPRRRMAMAYRYAVHY